MINVYYSNGTVTPVDGKLTEYALSGWYVLAARFETEEAALEFRRNNENAAYSHTHIVDMDSMTEIYEKSDVYKF